MLHQEVEDHPCIVSEGKVFEGPAIRFNGIEANTIAFSRRHNKVRHAIVSQMQIDDRPAPALDWFDSIVPERERGLHAIDAGVLHQCILNAPSKGLDICLEAGKELFGSEFLRVEERASENPRNIVGGRVEVSHVCLCLVRPSLDQLMAGRRV